ncbi:MAG: nucleotidyltransferase domain-containing protein [Rhodocyclaceae bacterium]|nr:nucleotidyltransferase domain-containing protein [Rhodocyclaceae bacterium]
MELSPAQRSTVEQLARRHGWRLVMLFGSSAFGQGRDVDIAVLPASAPDLATETRWQAELADLFAPLPVDLVRLREDMSPLLRFEVICAGRCLYEADEGLHDREYWHAFALHADAAPYRRELHSYLKGAFHEA